jgi:hypothetical protein
MGGNNPGEALSTKIELGETGDEKFPGLVSGQINLYNVSSPGYPHVGIWAGATGNRCPYRDPSRPQVCPSRLTA